MKVKLVDPMPLHPWLCYPGTNESLRAVGLRSDGLPLWPLMGGDGEDDGDESEEDGEDGEEEESDEGEDDNADDKSSKAKSKKKAGPVSREEFDALTNRLRAADKRRSEAEKKAADLLRQKEEEERKGKPELDNVKKDLEKVTAERDSYLERFTSLARTNAFLTASAQAQIAWHDPEDAQAAGGKALRELEIDEEGNVEGIKEFVKDLARRKKYLVNTNTKNADDDDDAGTRRGASGSGVGSTKTGKGKKPNGELSREELIKRFPALGR